MHEYSLMEDVVTSVLDTLKKEGVESPDAVKEVVLKIGALDIHSEASFVQAFEVQVRDTLLAKAKLRLEIVPGRIRCAKCGHEGALGVGDADGHDPQPAVECPKCGEVCLVEGGRGMHPIDLVIEDK
jgi:hydrogenase nickel insertion protein HypA